MKIVSAVSSQVGNVRKNNEDNFYCNGFHLDETNRDNSIFYSSSSDEKIQIYAVCDGMGGEAYGELASFVSVKSIKNYHIQLKLKKVKDIERYLAECIQETNNRICEEIVNHDNKRMGTTIALVCFTEGKVYLFNVGDSSIYRMRKKCLEKLSKDHTKAEQMVNLGILTKEDAKKHPDRHMLTQHLGIDETEMRISPHTLDLDAVGGDIFFICSDGVTDVLSDSELKNILMKRKNENSLVNDIIIEAKRKGGRDNITAMVIRVGKRKLFGLI